MRFRERRPRRALLAAALVCSGMAGLTVSTTAGDANASSSVTLTFLNYNGGAAGSGFRYLVSQFNKTHKGVKVQLEVLPSGNYPELAQTRIQGGDPPDIVQLENIEQSASLVQAGDLANLTSQPWVGKLTDAAKDGSVSPGHKYYAFATETNAIGVFYNRAIFASLHLGVPTDWQEFLSDCAKIKAAGITPLAVGAASGWPLEVQWFAMAAELKEFHAGNTLEAELNAGKQKWSANPGAVKVTDGIATLVSDGYYEPNASGVDWPNDASYFASGKAAMEIQGDFAIPSYRTDNPKMNLGMFPLPYVNPGQTPILSTDAGALLAIPAKSAHLAQAESFLEFIANPRVMAEYTKLSAAVSPLKDPSSQGTLDPAERQILPALRAGHSNDYDLATNLSTAEESALASGLQGVFAGSGSPSAVLQAVDAAATSTS